MGDPTRENKWSGRNITRWRSAEYDRLWREAETEMDPVKRAALFIQLNDVVIQRAVVIPVTWRNVLHAVSNQIGGVQPQQLGLHPRQHRLLVSTALRADRAGLSEISQPFAALRAGTECRSSLATQGAG